MEIIVKETGKPNVVVDGDKYSLYVQCAAYDKDNTVVASESLAITGVVSESAETVKAKVAKAMEIWKLKVVATEEFKAKLGEI